jgi:cell division protein FtsB
MTAIYLTLSPLGLTGDCSMSVPLSAENTVPRQSRQGETHSWLWQLLVLLCFAATTVYFAHHALEGRHGFKARTRLIERSSMLEFEIRSLETVRSALARDAALLAAEPPSPDLVDELARDILGYADPRDRILRRRDM